MENASSGVRKEVKKCVAKNTKVKRKLQSFPHTMVIMTCEWDGHAFTASGHSECGPRDKWDKDLGMTVAVGRARKALVDKIVRYRVRHDADESMTVEMTLAKSMARFGQVAAG